MGIVSSSQRETVERRSSTLFLISGCLLLGHSGVLALKAFSVLTLPPDLFGPTGHLVALVGLLGLYPVVVDHRPTMTRAAGAVAAIALVSWGAMTATRLLAVAGAAGPDLFPGGAAGLMFLSTILTYSLFAIGTARVSEWPRRFGLLVVTPAILLVMVLMASAITGVAALAGVVVSVGLALAMFSLGYTLRIGATDTGQAERTGDATVG